MVQKSSIITQVSTANTACTDVRQSVPQTRESNLYHEEQNSKAHSLRFGLYLNLSDLNKDIVA